MSQHRHAFTLIELLVVIAILGVLLSILLPVITRVRTTAMTTVCSVRLRDVSLATMQFHDEHKRLPEPARDPSALPGMPLGPAIPHRISVALINDLRPYFKQSPIRNDLPVEQLSPTFQCPFVEGIGEDRGVFLPGTRNAYYYTGYAYVGRLEEGAAVVESTGPTPLLKLPVSLPVHVSLDKLPRLLRPSRSAGMRVTRRAPLWSDDLHYAETPSPSWTYWHRKRGSAPAGPVPLSTVEVRPVLGQHVAFTDGSVEWVPAADLELDVKESAARERKASFKLPGVFVWWF